MPKKIRFYAMHLIRLISIVWMTQKQLGDEFILTAHAHIAKWSVEDSGKSHRRVLNLNGIAFVQDEQQNWMSCGNKLSGKSMRFPVKIRTLALTRSGAAMDSKINIELWVNASNWFHSLMLSFNQIQSNVLVQIESDRYLWKWHPKWHNDVCMHSMRCTLYRLDTRIVYSVLLL